MIKKIAIVCLGISSILPLTFGQTTKQNPQTSQSSQGSPNLQNKAQPPNVAQITKIDAGKMTLSVKADAPESSSTGQAVSGSTQRRSNRARKSSSRANGKQAKQYKVYLTQDTVLKDGETIISLSSLKVGERILVTGSPKGDDIQAAQVARSK